MATKKKSAKNAVEISKSTSFKDLSAMSVADLNKKSVEKFGREFRALILLFICSPIDLLYNEFEIRP